MQSPEIDTKGIKGIGISMKEYFSHGKTIATSYALGLAIGFMPGMGAGLSNVVAYAGLPRQNQKRPKSLAPVVLRVLLPLKSQTMPLSEELLSR